jgi:WD40 repeat protein
MSPSNSPKATPRQTLANRLFGYDIFISFALGPQPRGTHSYASDLARRLREREFTVFFSEDDATPGEVLDAALVHGLNRSKALVVVANRGTLSQPRWVRTEVEVFRRRHPTRPVIPISVDGALADPVLADSAKTWLTDATKIWLDESEAAVVNGLASEQVVDRLAMVPRKTRSNVAWRWVVRAVVAGLGVLSLGLAATAWVAIERDARARAELRRAVSARLLSDSLTMLSGERSGGDERALLQVLAAYRIEPSAATEGGLLSAVLYYDGLQKLVPLAGTPRAVAFSPDGAGLVTGDFEGFLRWWDAGSGQPTRDALRAHDQGVSSLAFMPDGERLVSAGDDGKLRLWDARTGGAISGPMVGDTQYVHRVAVSPDGSRIVSAGGDRTLRLWNSRTGAPFGTPLVGHTGQVRGIAFSPDSRRIASIDSDAVVRLWDAVSGAPLGHIAKVMSDTLLRQVGHVAFSHDGHQLYTGDSESWRRWNADTGQPVSEPVPVPESGATLLVVSPDGSRLVTADKGLIGRSDNSLRQWRAEDSQPIGKPLRHRGNVTGLAFSADGRRIASVSHDKTLRIWDATAGQYFAPPSDKLGRYVTSFSPDGGRVVTGGVSDSLRLWDLQTAKAIGTPTNAPYLSAIAFSPDGRHFATGSLRKVVRLWDALTGQPIGYALLGQQYAVWHLAFSPDGKLLVAGGNGPDLQLWDVPSGSPSGAPLSGHRSGVTGVAFSPDGRRIVATTFDGGALLWDTQSRKLVKEVNVSSRLNNVKAPAFSPDGQAIILGVGAQLYLWDLASTPPVATVFGLAEHQGSVESLIFSPEGRYVLSGSEDQTLRVWDVATRQPIGPPIKGHVNSVVSLGLTADGRYVISSSNDGALRRWPVPATWPEQLCAKLTRNVSTQEWRDWVSPEIPYVVQCPGLPQASEPLVAADEGERHKRQTTPAMTPPRAASPDEVFQEAERYRTGDDGAPRDSAKAAQLYLQAAQQGHGMAAFDLGTMYSEGVGVPKDDNEAWKWWSRASEVFRKGAVNGDRHEQGQLGLMYQHGLGVSQDKAEAVRWYRKAADQRSWPAARFLGQMYEKGEGVPKDEIEATKWYRKAAEYGDPTGTVEANRLVEKRNRR